MQFNVLAVLAAVAAVASAQSTVTVYECEPTTPAVVVPSVPVGTGVPSVPVASTGFVNPPKPTGPPIFEGAASVNGASALGMIVAGAFALLI